MTYTYRGTETAEVEDAWARALGLVPKPPRRGNGKALCGTVGGRYAHTRRKETPCEPCRVAHNTHQQAKRGSKPTGRKNNPVAQCGTISGHQRHRRQGEKPCFQCRVAEANYVREKRARKKAAAQ